MFLPESIKQRSRVESRAGDALHQPGSPIALPVPMHLLAQPAQESAEVSLLELFLQVYQLPRRGSEELLGEEIAECVRREIADEAVAPVTVLQTALRVAWRRDAEIALVGLVPGGGDVGDAQIAGDQGDLQLEPNEDVQVVGDLVGADAVGAWRDMIDGAVEVLGVNVVQRLMEDLASARKKVPPERAAAA